MIHNQLSNIATHAGQTTDLSISLAPGNFTRAIRVIYLVTLNSGATPVIRAGLFDLMDTGFINPYDQDATLNASGGGILFVEFPPPLIKLLFDIGPVAQNWNIAYRVQIITED